MSFSEITVKQFQSGENIFYRVICLYFHIDSNINL